ncbi:MAG: nickel pincer cofactor biosynthesis protein LarB [Victivallales bacterium]|nr:nickel pincer cofactor biosynthesis protein LarB [Victivallales bacterium]
MPEHPNRSEFARLDFQRRARRGAPETVYCASKTNEQLIEIYRRFHEAGEDAFGTRATPEQAEAVRAVFSEVQYDSVSRVLLLRAPSRKASEGAGCVAVCCGGTSDLPVAEEAAQTAEFLGSRMTRFYDIGIACLDRVLGCIDEIRQANAVIAVAGMEGALPSVIAGMVAVPVIAVPTSVGYGASFQGVAPLLTMLNSCAEGIAVVNIDNGYGAGYLANQINQLAISN